MVPRVAMNGGSLNFPTNIPFTTPVTRQHIIATAMATNGFTPIAIRVAEIMALIPTMEPMERSIFPVIRR